MTDAARIAVDALLARYFAAYAGHDAAGCAATYTSDAWITSPWGPMVQGRSAIEKTHTEWFGAQERNKVYRILDLQVAGGIGICLLRFDAEVPDGDGMTPVAGVSLNGLKEIEPGVWAITHTSLNELEVTENE